MPMNRGFDRQLVPDEHFEVVSLVDFNQRTGLLAVDEIHFTSDTV